MTVSIVFMGFFVGTLVGLTGVGGAALLTPLLIVLGINPSIAVGTDLYITPSPNCSVSFLIGSSAPFNLN